MQTIIKYVVLLALGLSVQLTQAQDTIPAIKNRKAIEKLENYKLAVENKEKQLLKVRVEEINKELSNGAITEEESNRLKNEAAEKAALNIENRWAIINNQIALYKRNIFKPNADDKENKLGLMVVNRTFSIKGKKREPRDNPRTSIELTLAVGYNSALIKGQGFKDSPYQFKGVDFTELGCNWKTKVFKNSQLLRFKYGVSLQWNKLNIKNNQYFMQDGNGTYLEQFPADLNKSKLKITNLVVPLFFEFGPLKKMDRKDDRIVYLNSDQFKIGVGGYAGLNLGAQQKLKYVEGGSNIKEKLSRSSNASNFVYGLSGYIGIGDISLYAKYDLSPLFKDQIIEQHNISLGLRFDID
ncbi:hypothetical protein [Snuella lapsa]|uniref:Outer membrane protein beta-barrel domain-containing protein n=1 Tax=Snuella lapsa TaxID=870481 RepID=A0ABP6X979_9FLAO